jgi:hypothetical protein
MIDEISFFGAKMLNVKDNRLRFMKHIQNKFFGGVDVVMTCDFYQTPFMNDNWLFKLKNKMLMHLHQIFGKHMSNVMN